MVVANSTQERGFSGRLFRPTNSANSKVGRHCRSVKVKRLFLWFAERHQHAWLNKLDRNRVDLGKGNRMLVRGGKLDPKFKITVSESIDAGG